MPSDRGVSSLKGLLKATVTDSIPTTAWLWTNPHGADGVWYPPPVCVQKGSGPIYYTRGGSSIIVPTAQELEGCFACMYCRHTQIVSARSSDLFTCLHWWQLFFSTLLGMLGDLITELSPRVTVSLRAKVGKHPLSPVLSRSPLLTPHLPTEMRSLPSSSWEHWFAHKSFIKDDIFRVPPFWRVFLV